ncbi:MAG: NUDIX domain-containing protein [Candidatus Paceibacterota bacterium]|jgi:ADP-ribose pyrophosphatase YjhB (NUDIX family)
MTKYLKILYNSDIFPKSEIKKPKKYEKRETVKAIVLNRKGEIALVTNPIHNLFSLPGGGAESVNLEIEIIRECLEETNQEVKIIGMVGKTKEFRDKYKKEFTTTCFVAKAVKKFKKDSRTEEEIKNGLRVVWVNKKKLINIFNTQNKKVKAGKINFYNTAFNIVRDGIFIKEYFNNYDNVIL